MTKDKKPNNVERLFGESPQDPIEALRQLADFFEEQKKEGLTLTHVTIGAAAWNEAEKDRNYFTAGFTGGSVLDGGNETMFYLGHCIMERANIKLESGGDYY